MLQDRPLAELLASSMPPGRPFTDPGGDEADSGHGTEEEQDDEATPT